jgi:D-alanyl-D-alanine carboxypeptidase (penicillin-binding protein 5/6)
MDLKASMDLPNRLIAPFSKGQQVGTLHVTLDGKPLAERPLVALADAPPGGFWGRMSDGILLWFKGDKKSDVSAVPNTK